ncbi:hypothetical protein [Hydrogenimonas thermophila]|uniref:Cytochrome C and Quinol oxidase polypeptide I n=1 Tax=Hydrogenimonas thermophila TaxID=223786 RepID=A0A1I5T032_9BACT|nr:hypothetical protein [Hydrogenimonas thermophila]WOE70684.1 hypothetical protein RZR91_03715 [Hydrogenimonas thermophila]WOE73202.1 hypothetical protein RZR97_03705 [Hydrogenimonas thermophila]SFP76380.1 hypothetical protein SAMN05216234_1395 [Hydrogenimonas thermophila]
MFNQGLSLDQAPPFGVILRFFLTIPFFGVLTALAIFGADSASIMFWDAPQTVAIVHLTLLGIAGMAMIGALFQMLPVIAGATIKNPLFHSKWIHLFMVLGTLMLSSAFYFEKMALLHPALALLLVSLVFIVALMLFNLLRVENKTASVTGMITALVGFSFGLLFALLSTLSFMGVDLGLSILDLRTIHMHFMLFGWITLLIMAVAFQVIEMFYVTPPYPNVISKWFPLLTLSILVLQVPFYLLNKNIVVFFDYIIGGLLLTFALVTLKRLTQRKRPVADTTVWLWRTGLSSLALSVLFAFISTFTEVGRFFDFAGLLFGYFVMSIIFAMSYKIIPFLVWFHLNAKGVLECPMMGDIIEAKRTKWHLYLHWLLLGTLIVAIFSPLFWKFTALVLLVESLLFGANLFGAAKIYNSLKDKGML